MMSDPRKPETVATRGEPGFLVVDEDCKPV